jgi:ERF superfamily
MVHLTTTLAHASGEWIASDWPVCPISETANPQHMGAALTYARRYALFTLVGIAGEDDLDAPDLCAGPNASSSTAPERALQPRGGSSPGQPRGTGNGRGRGSTKNEAHVILDSTQSAQLRDKLLIEVENIASADLATTWAGEALVAKNSLTATDAKLVEDAFERRLSDLLSSEAAAPSNHESSVPQIAAAQVIATREITDPGQAKGIDKSILTVAAPRRYRSREHLRYVMQQPCLVCGRKPSDPHHLRYMQARALGRKASDEFAVPLCRSHHRAVHRAGDEQAWWKAAGIDPVKVARQLWRQTRLNDPQEHHQAGLARPETRSIASAPDATRESRSDQGAMGPADDGRAP